MNDFIHLHNHSHYSLQDAACTIDALIEAAKKNEMQALALTDHGVMYGISEFYKKAKSAGIKPIVGMEAYIVMEGSRFDRGKENLKPGGRKQRDYNHLVLLAKNKTGYKNLVKLSTLGFTEGFYYKPRIDLELLKKYSEGLICTSACLAGPVSAHLLNGNYEKAKENAIILKEIFDKDFYLEIQDHGLEKDLPILEGIPKLAKEINTPVVATNDIHYIEREHSVAHNILLLLSDKSGRDYRDLRYQTDQIYFKSAEEMKKLFGKYKGAIDSTLEIAEKVDLNLDFEKFHYPVFPIPENSKAKNLDEYFELLAREGLEKKIDKITSEVEERFKYEVEIIKSMGYSGYFLITQDFINAAKNRGVPVGPGRGSAAGSLVAYALGITNVNPLDYDLLFERFLNPDRKSMPDIDVDFADDQRSVVIDYVKEKYGEESVSQIITFNRLSSKQVIRDVARVLKIPIPTVNEITKFIPSKFGKVYSIEKALNEVPELKWVRDSDDPQIQELIKYSKILEGMNRNASKHAAGVVITPGPVSDYVPLAVMGGNGGDLVTQFNMKELDSAGLLKMDFLGLSTLSIIRNTIKLVKENRGIDIDMENIPLDDKKTYQLFAKGQTTAVFQFESAPMREYLKKLKPTSIKDLAAMNALYRPGPMEYIDEFIARKHGRKTFDYLHPSLEPILKETYGIMVYQEQVIQIANKIAGMTLAEADILRRAMGKKDLKAMQEQKKKFIEGAIKNKIPKKIAIAIFEDIDKFANYGFNKSHAVAYSIVAYQTAYLKAHYLPEFLAANLTVEFEKADKVTTLLEDCRRLNVKVSMPDVNRPSVSFTVKGNEIIFGMSAIKNVGVNAVKEIERARQELGRNFKTIYDFCRFVDTRIVNKRALESLVLAGALDSLEGNRAQKFKAIEKALSFGSKARTVAANHVNSLFGAFTEHVEIEEPALPDVPPWKTTERLAKEREVLGFYLSGHPLKKFVNEYNSFSTVQLGKPETYKNSENVRACGVILDLRTRIDKSGRKMAFFKLDDFSGSCEGIMFGKDFQDNEDLLKMEATVLVRGKLESSGDRVKLIADSVMSLPQAREQLTKKIVIIVQKEIHKPEIIGKLHQMLQKFPGNIPVYILLAENGDKRNFMTDVKVKMDDELIENLNGLLGENSLRFVTR